MPWADLHRVTATQREDVARDKPEELGTVETETARAALITDRVNSRATSLLIPLGLAVLLGILWFANYNPITGFTPGTDSGVYLYIGQQILKGAAPYRDVFDNKGPLLYLVNAVGLAIGFGSFWGVYVLEYCLLALSTILIYLMLKVRVGWLVASFVAVFFILEAAHITVGNHEEEYAVVLQSVALFLLVRKPALEARSWPWFVAGVLAAGALFLKPTGIGLWVSLTITVAIVCSRAGEWRDGRRHLLMGLCGAATASLALLAYLAASGAIGGFAADFIGFNVMYVGNNGMGGRLSSIVYGAGQVGYTSAAIVVAAWTLVLCRGLRRHNEGRSADALALLAVVWLPVEVLLSATSGYSRMQYYFPWLLPATLLLALALVELKGLPQRVFTGRHIPLRSCAVALLVGLAFVGLLSPTLGSFRDLAGSILHYRVYAAQTPQAEQLAAYVAAHTEPTDNVLVWGGYEASVNMLAERRSPSRYVMQLALYYDAYATKGVPEFLRELESHPPALILDSSPSFGAEREVAVPPIDSTSNPWASKPGPVSAAWSSVFAYLHEHYRRVGTVPFAPWWPVYVPR